MPSPVPPAHDGRGEHGHGTAAEIIRELQRTHPGAEIVVEITTIRISNSRPESEEVERREVEEAILTALQECERPVPSRELCELAGYRPGSYFRAALTRLVRAGLIVRTREGYRPAEAARQ